jgi:hypothetical protein
MRYIIVLVIITALVGCKPSLHEYRVEYSHVGGIKRPGKPTAIGIGIEEDTIQARNDSEAYAIANAHRSAEIQAHDRLPKDTNRVFHIGVQVFKMDGTLVEAASR